MKEASRNNLHSGSTTTIVLVADDKTLVANIGDSKAILCPENFQSPREAKGKVRTLDVEFLEEVAGEYWNGDCAVYAFNAGLLSKVSSRGKLEVSLETLQCEIYTVSPIRVFGRDAQFAPRGLLDMYNSGGLFDIYNVKYNRIAPIGSFLAGAGGRYKELGCESTHESCV
ncbi:galactinol--sucrose galactosyltransferase 2 [Spatholobus suberectus]|nr:galactinol--sucrose galactosyltransferase 2 [Spatholobus suberectus]